MDTTLDTKTPALYIEVLTKGESGFVRDDTAGTPFVEKIDCPGITFVPSTGYMAEPILDEKGKETGRFKNVKIRYIKNCPLIKESDQIKEGYQKSPIATTDSIAIQKGKSLIKDEGDRALYEYLSKVFYNAAAPNRSKTAKAIYTVVQLDQKVTEINETKFIQARAIGYVESLVLKTGKTYKYKEQEIDNLLTALSIYGGDSYSDKIGALTHEAEKNPSTFLKTVAVVKSTVATEISHALSIGLLHFEGEVCQYMEGKKILGTVSKEITSQSKKIEALSEMLKTPEYAQAYQDFKVQFEIAQEKQLTK